MENGKLTVTTPDGDFALRTVNTDDNTRALLEGAQKYNTETADMYVRLGRQSEIPAEVFDNYFDILYNEGKQGVQLGAYGSQNHSINPILDDMGIHQDIYNRGVADAQIGAQEIDNTITRKGTGSFKGKMSDKAAQYIARTIAAKTGIDVTVNPELDENNPGRYIPAIMTLELSPDAKAGTVIHELGEVLKAINPNGYETVANSILEWYNSIKGYKSADEAIKVYQKAYAAEEGAKSYEQAKVEYINEALGGIFASENGAQDFIDWLTENKTPQQRNAVIQWFVDALDKIRELVSKFFKEAGLNSYQTEFAELAAREENRARDLRKQFLSLLDVAVDIAANTEVVEGDTTTTYNVNGDMVMEETGDSVRNNIKTWELGGRETLEKKLKNLVKSKKSPLTIWSLYFQVWMKRTESPPTCAENSDTSINGLMLKWLSVTANPFSLSVYRTPSTSIISILPRYAKRDMLSTRYLMNCRKRGRKQTLRNSQMSLSLSSTTSSKRMTLR